MKNAWIFLAVSCSFGLVAACSGDDNKGNGGGNDAGNDTASSGGSSGGSSGSSSGTSSGGSSGSSSGMMMMAACMSKADCASKGADQICCASPTSVADQCQAGPCGNSLLGRPLQICMTSSECFNAGETCNPFTIPGVGITINTCGTSDGGAGEGGTTEAGPSEGGTHEGGTSDGGTEAGPADAASGG